jgi:hypothetical protein
MVQRVQFDESLKALWDKAANQMPFFSFAWHKRYQEIFTTTPLLFADTDHEYIMALEKDGSVAHFGGGQEIADYLDVIGADDKKELAWQEGMPLLKVEGIQQLVLRNIPEGSTTLTYFKSLNAAITQEDVTPVALLPATFDAYLAGLDRKARHELKRKVRKFEEAYPAATIETRHGSDVDMRTMIQLMKSDAQKKVFLSPQMESFFLELPTIAADTLVQLNLRVGDTIVSTLLGFRVGAEFLLYNSGFDPAFAGSGFYLKAKAMQWAIDQGITRFNFLQGAERYKYELGGKDEHVYRIEYIF